MNLASNAILQPSQLDDQGNRVLMLALGETVVQYPSGLK